MNRNLSVLIAAAALCSLASAQTLRPIQRINSAGFNPSGNNQQDGVHLAVQGTRFVAVFADQFGVSSTKQDIFAVVSNDSGLTWGPMVRIDTGDAPNLTDGDEAKCVITQSGAIVAVWEETKGAFGFGSSNEDIYFNRSTDGGATWLPSALPLNTGTSGSNITSDIDRIWITSSGESVYVTWEEDALSSIGADEEVWFTKSDDAGVTWSTPIVIEGNGTVDADDPRMVAVGQTVLVTFAAESATTDDIVVLRSTDGGVNWTRTVVESNDQGDSDTPDIAVDGQNVIVIWEDDNPSLTSGDQIHAVVSNDLGATWSSEITISQRSENQVSTPISQAIWSDCAVLGDSMYVVYAEDSLNTAAGLSGGQLGSRVYVAYSHDAGATWTVDVNLDSNSASRFSNRPSLGVTNCAVFVQFETGNDGSNGISYTLSQDGGATWATAFDAPAGPDIDSPDPSENRGFVVDPAQNVALGIFWDRPLGQNEVYVCGLAGCTPAPQSYCTAGTTTNGCNATISAVGAPSIAALSGYPLTVTNVEGQKQGILFYGVSGAAVQPWGTGSSFLCVKSPTQRMGGLNSGGTTGLCDGVLVTDWSAFVASNPSALGVPFSPGQVVSAQGWFRDPPASKSTSLSNAIEFTLIP
jgi:hypothetical protein